jgi:hypothetical protein
MLRTGSRRLKIISVGNESGRVLLTAHCKDKEGTWQENSVVFSDYVAKDGENLAWTCNGNFQASCLAFEFELLFPDVPFISLKHDHLEGVTLRAVCKNGKGGYKETDLNLDDKLSNQAGVLAVDGF